jgi:predicted AlkP superfamily phosphohydrolase/phosphomutase
MGTTGRVLMIGLDAFDAELVEKWSDDGTLPSFASFFERASYGRLAPPNGLLLGPPWPTFHTGRPVSEHGLYEYLVWRPDRMDETRASSIRDLTPFWRQLGNEGPRSVVIDVPLVPSPEPFNGVEVTCWATHERLVPFGTYPEDLAGRINESVGREPMPLEAHHRLPYARLLAERDALCDTTRSVTDLAERLLGDEEWDLGIVCYSTAHRAGHKLWSDTGTTGRGADGEAEEFGEALRDVYRAIDESIGRLLAIARPEDHVLIFALHGMGPNTSRALVLPQILDRILRGETASGPSLLGSLRNAVPLGLRGWVKRRLPVGVQDRLGTFWRKSGDWSETRAISLAADVHGFIRINLAGREAQGIVPPEEYEAVCDEIAEGLLGFVDADSGLPIVERVVRRREAYPEGASADLLPDLIVVWADRPVSEHRALVSESFGTVDWPDPGTNPDGRSGNHRPEGWAACAGPSILGPRRADATILDLAPTALALLGSERLPDLAGCPLYSGE